MACDAEGASEPATLRAGASAPRVSAGRAPVPKLVHRTASPEAGGYCQSRFIVIVSKGRWNELTSYVTHCKAAHFFFF